MCYNTCRESAEITWSSSFKGVHPQGTRNPLQASSVSAIHLIPTEVNVAPSLHFSLPLLTPLL